MARKQSIQHTLIRGQSLAANFNSPVTVISYLDNCSYQINVTTSDSNGSFAVQGSNDYVKAEPSGVVSNAGNWFTLNIGSPGPSVVGANDVIAINLNQVPYSAIRLAYTASVAGTGTCDIIIMNKSVGA